MSGRAFDTPSTKTQSARLAIIVPLAAERQCISGSVSDNADVAITIHQSGQGSENAARAAHAALDQGATALMSVGVAGGLIDQLHAGDVVIADQVLDAENSQYLSCTEGWVGELRELVSDVGKVHVGKMLTVTDVLCSTDDKASAAQRYQAIACDMESAAIARVAHDAGVHFAVLRVISDTRRDALPADIADWIDESGGTRLRPVLRALMTPAGWRSIVSMSRRFRLAQRRLKQLSSSLAAAGYCCPIP